jgi:adenylate cyclase
MPNYSEPNWLVSQSERKQAEEALLKAGALQKAIFNSANFSSIATDAQGVIQIFNVGAERMLGYTAAEVVDQITPAAISDPQELIARAAALSLELETTITPGFEALVFKASRGIEDIYELTYIRKDGSRFPAIVSVTALRDAQNTIIGYLLIGTDNTARKQVEEKLRWTEESFRLMVESVTDYAIVMLDPEGRVVSWNAGAERIKGYSAEEIVGQHFSRFYPQEDIESGKPQRDLDVVAAKGQFEDEGWRVRQDGSAFWANVVFTAIRDQRGHLRGFAKLTRDLTEPMKIEATLTKAKDAADAANAALELRNRFIRETFGSYLSDEIVDTILEKGGLKIGGEKRRATILMADLRGFTSLSEHLPAEDVVAMINIYLETMTEIIQKYQGTIDEFIGDAILVIFGAPILRPDDPQRAVACAVEMQLAMTSVNDWNRRAGYPEIALGIGITTGEVVVGNIGSQKRIKYAVVGRAVNLTARIESYTVGGQIFISESTLDECGDILRIDSAMQVMPKGVKKPLTIHEVGGIGGDFQLFLPPKKEMTWIELKHGLRVQFTVVDWKHTGELGHGGAITKIAHNMVEIHSEVLPSPLANLRISLYDRDDHEISDDLYGKVVAHLSESPSAFLVHFTSIPPEAEAFLAKFLGATLN